ncbi:MAG TPA: hypothetical protein VNG13_08590 [Mycobacteriales bacterium]|nr:hypothetical protein [Mycobacteriales bacterium]
MEHMFEVEMNLRVFGPNRAKNFDAVTDAYYTVEQGDARLLDCAWDYAECDDSGEVDVQITVTGSDEKDAYAKASTAVRTAIHATGGLTPGWEDIADRDVSAYRVTRVEVELIPA